MIVTELLKVQKQRELNDSQFAKMLGIHKGSWSRNKQTRTISAATVLRAFKLFPELKGAILSQSDLNDVSFSRTETTQNGFLARFKAWWVGFVIRALKIWHNSREA